MAAVMTFAKMTARYPGEWLLIGEPKLDSALQVICGKVLAHSRSRDEIYRKLSEVHGKRVSVEYTGKVPADIAVAL